MSRFSITRAPAHTLTKKTERLGLRRRQISILSFFTPLSFGWLPARAVISRGNFPGSEAGGGGGGASEFKVGVRSIACSYYRITLAARGFFGEEPLSPAIARSLSRLTQVCAFWLLLARGPHGSRALHLLLTLRCRRDRALWQLNLNWYNLFRFLFPNASRAALCVPNII